MTAPPAIMSIVLLIAALTAGTTAAQDDSHAAHRAATRTTANGAPTSVTLPGTSLIQGNGQPFRLNAEAFGSRVVVIDFVFTSCKTICPLLNAVMASLQGELGERLGDDVMLVSMSVDPARDTPSRMSEQAEEVGAGPYWIWLTGSRVEIDRSLRAFGLPSGRPDDHPPTILVGNPGRGEWLKWVGLPPVSTLAQAALAMAGDAPVHHHEPHHDVPPTDQK